MMTSLNRILFVFSTCVRNVLLLPLILAMISCSSVGPKTVPEDQFNYNAAIAESTHEQLLLNLVRLRYSEKPVFLKVSSVISQYSRVVTAKANAGANTAFTGANTASVGGGVIWSDKPTISYTPISGREFSRNLLTPIAPSAVFEMMQSGWPVELVFQSIVWSINDIRSEIARPSNRRQADPKMFELFSVWRELREAGVLGTRKTKVEGQQESLVMYLREGPMSESQQKSIQRLRELLGLDSEVQQYQIVYGLVPQRGDELTVLTGSVWDIMLNMAWQFEVPPAHIQSGRTGDTFRSDHDGSNPPIEVLYTEEEPDDAFVAVNEHGYWFYIDQCDRKSKRIFSFLQLLLNLAETSTPDNAPVISISN